LRPATPSAISPGHAGRGVEADRIKSGLDAVLDGLPAR
jgi:hypothetical protein